MPPTIEDIRAERSQSRQTVTSNCFICRGVGNHLCDEHAIEALQRAASISLPNSDLMAAFLDSSDLVTLCRAICMTPLVDS